jgi:hypothetical protein
VASEGTETALEPDADEASDVPEESVAQDGADVDGADESADDSEKGAN